MKTKLILSLALVAGLLPATGSGANEFQYDILNQEAQLGFTIHF